MKTKEFNKLAREQLRSLLPGFEVGKGLLFEAPVRELLRAFTFQGSSYDKSFYLVAFVQPLYVPADEELPTFSERSRRLSGVEATDEIASFVRGAGLKFLEGMQTPADLAEWLEREETGHKPDPFALEALAYSLVLTGHEEDAKRWLELARETAGAYVRDDVAEDLYSEDEEHPLEPVLERVAQVREALERAPDAAIELLNRWREGTAQKLGLSDYLAPLDRSRSPSS